MAVNDKQKIAAKERFKFENSMDFPPPKKIKHGAAKEKQAVKKAILKELNNV